MADCRHKDGSNCLVSEVIIDERVDTRTEQACDACLRTLNPKDMNPVTLSLAIAFCLQHEREDVAQQISNDHADILEHMRVKLPSFLTEAFSLTKAVAAFVGGGLRIVTKEVYQDRLTKCDVCPLRIGERDSQRCPSCGCLFTLKARVRSASCDLNFWRRIP